MQTEKAKPKFSGSYTITGLPEGYTVNIFELNQTAFNVRGMLQLSHEGKRLDYSVEGDNFVPDVKLNFKSTDGNTFSFEGMFDDDGTVKGFLNGQFIGDVKLQQASKH
jgi:hypothetical protein